MKITTEELIQVSIKACKLLQEKGNPHMAIIITDDRVKLVSDELSAPVKYEV